MCKECLLELDGGKEWMEQEERNEEYRNTPDMREENDTFVGDWYSTAPRMSGSTRLTEDGHVVKKNGYN